MELEIRNTNLTMDRYPYLCRCIAPTKALSKVANKIARKFPQETKGVYVIDSEEKRIKALAMDRHCEVFGESGHRLQKTTGSQKAVKLLLISHNCPMLGFKRKFFDH